MRGVLTLEKKEHSQLALKKSPHKKDRTQFAFGIKNTTPSWRFALKKTAPSLRPSLKRLLPIAAPH